MFDPRNPSATQASSGTPGERPERIMKIAPLDLRQQRFRKAFRGFDPIEVVAFLTEAADDYEQALREIDQLRQDLSRSEALLSEHREREANLRNTLITAQRLADEVKEAAQTEAKLILREAQGQANLSLEKARARRDQIDREIEELRLRRHDVEASLEASIQALYHALEFIRNRDRQHPDETSPPHAPERAEDVQQEPASGADVLEDDQRATGHS